MVLPGKEFGTLKEQPPQFHKRSITSLGSNHMACHVIPLKQSSVPGDCARHVDAVTGSDTPTVTTETGKVPCVHMALER
jgi:hypothetical protein